MTDHDPASVVDPEEAARILGVAPEQIAAMVDEGMLRPLPDGGQFDRSEVDALRVQGG